MRIVLQDPIGEQIPIETETCPQKGETVLFRGRKYVVRKIEHITREDKNLRERLVTIVNVSLFTEKDLG